MTFLLTLFLQVLLAVTFSHGASHSGRFLSSFAFQVTRRDVDPTAWLDQVRMDSGVSLAEF